MTDDLFQFHQPVLVEEVLLHLFAGNAATAGGLVVDGTVGAGGHATAILEAAPGVTLLGLDRDPQALDIAKRTLEPFGARATLAHQSYADLASVLESMGIDSAVGVLLDLGLSSMQLDDESRGFSFRFEDAVPDMRFDPTDASRSASDLVNHASERELADILHELGEEPRARAVARAIVRARPIRSAGQLADVIRSAALRVRRIDAATRSLQGLRMAVNEEIAHLRRGLRAAVRALAPGGRLVVICFHSGEEREVKAAFREAKRDRLGTILTKKPIRPTEAEVKRNPRARPARLRAFERAKDEDEGKR